MAVGRHVCPIRGADVATGTACIQVGEQMEGNPRVPAEQLRDVAKWPEGRYRTLSFNQSMVIG